ncbi:MAG: hypothetical protein R2822_00050 [Spirosomataceae bacterium]
METKKVLTKADKREKALQISRRLAEHYRETNRILETVLLDAPSPKKSAS